MAEAVGPETPTPARSARRLVGIAVVLTLLAGSVLGVLWIRGAGRSTAVKRPSSADAELVSVPASPAMEDTYGIRIMSVAITAGGGMVQMRYQVLDADKVQTMHDETIGPFVVGSSGTLFDAPGMTGHSHGRLPGLGGTGYVLLANTKGGVRPGDTVTIRMGTITIPGVKVL